MTSRQQSRNISIATSKISMIVESFASLPEEGPLVAHLLHWQHDQVAVGLVAWQGKCLPTGCLYLTGLGSSTHVAGIRMGKGADFPITTLTHIVWNKLAALTSFLFTHNLIHTLDSAVNKRVKSLRW